MTTFTDNDIAFVTGGGSGIGRATCQLLAEQGATVVAADIDKIAADLTVLNLPGKNHLSLQLDVTKQADVAAAIANVISKYSTPPNIAVNCAGVVLMRSLLDVTEENYNIVFNVNVKGTLWVTQAVSRALLAAGKTGAIVNISSVAKQGVPLLSVYGATKGAVESLTFAAAKEFGLQGIRVNVICPGFTDTPLIEAMPQSLKDMYIKTVPLQRHAKPKEMAEVIVFLASNKSSYVNGTSMYVHGGYF